MIFLYLIATYLISSIPFGLIIAKIFSDKDLRKEGSGNIGATNVARVLGKKLAILVFLLDALKGYIPVVLIKFFFADHSNMSQIVIIASLVAVCGHIFSIYLKFKGGKGVATLIGGIFYYDPLLTIIIAIGWYIIFYITRIVSIASIVILIVISLYFALKFSLIFSGLTIAPIICIYRHKDNIKRILEGKEKSF